MKPILTTTTGSYPIINEPLSTNWQVSVQLAVEAQIEAGIDLLVDGQVRSDIAGLFAPVLGQNKSNGKANDTEVLPHQIKVKITPQAVDSRALIEDYKYAQEVARSKGRTDPSDLKAHITGPVFLAESCRITQDAPYRLPKTLTGDYDVDPDLVYDIADALTSVVREYRAAGAKYIQIDEPSLAYSSKEKMEVTLEALARLVRVDPQATWILHTCGNIQHQFSDLIEKTPPALKVLFIEAAHLREMQNVDEALLSRTQRQIMYGCIPVNTGTLPGTQKLQRELAETVNRLGPKNVFGVSPYCGLRLSTPDHAQQTMHLLTEAARVLG